MFIRWNIITLDMCVLNIINSKMYSKQVILSNGESINYNKYKHIDINKSIKLNLTIPQLIILFHNCQKLHRSEMKNRVFLK